MHLKKIADFAAQKIVFFSILLSIILFISPKRRPAFLAFGNGMNEDVEETKDWAAAIERSLTLEHYQSVLKMH